jgi:hypothetical protein
LEKDHKMNFTHPQILWFNEFEFCVLLIHTNWDWCVLIFIPSFLHAIIVIGHWVEREMEKCQHCFRTLECVAMKSYFIVHDVNWFIRTVVWLYSDRIFRVNWKHSSRHFFTRGDRLFTKTRFSQIVTEMTKRQKEETWNLGKADWIY